MSGKKRGAIGAVACDRQSSIEARGKARHIPGRRLSSAARDSSGLLLEERIRHLLSKGTEQELQRQPKEETEDEAEKRRARDHRRRPPPPPPPLGDVALVISLPLPLLLLSFFRSRIGEHRKDPGASSAKEQMEYWRREQRAERGRGGRRLALLSLDHKEKKRGRDKHHRPPPFLPASTASTALLPLAPARDTARASIRRTAIAAGIRERRKAKSKRGGVFESRRKSSVKAKQRGKKARAKKKLPSLKTPSTTGTGGIKREEFETRGGNHVFRSPASAPPPLLHSGRIPGRRAGERV